MRSALFLKAPSLDVGGAGTTGGSISEGSCCTGVEDIVADKWRGLKEVTPLLFRDGRVEAPRVRVDCPEYLTVSHVKALAGVVGYLAPYLSVLWGNMHCDSMGR
jgi:hypothetical protein